MVPVGDRVELKKKECREFLENLNNSKIVDFDEYMLSTSRLNIIKINILTWELSTCTCKAWLKDYKCKYVIVVYEILDIVDYSVIGMDVALARKRKRGRPANTVSALQLQPNDLQPRNILVEDDNNLIEEPPAKKQRGRKKKENIDSQDKDQIKNRLRKKN
jgi:hypothetical protein